MTPTLSLAATALLLYTASAVEVQESFLETLRSSRPTLAQGSSPRDRTCIVASNNDGSDDAELILSAVNDCNPGGHVLFPRGQSYTVGTPMDISNLTNVDVDIQGYIQFTNDTDFWQENAFDFNYQNGTSFFLLGGEDVNVYGGGTLDGNGQAWYDLYAKNKKIKRPVLFATAGLQGGAITDLHLEYSPFWHNIVINSSDVIFSNISIFSVSHNENFMKNTDGWDTYRSNRITIQNSTITNGDDCVSFKPNSTNILVQHLQCNGTHGISVGSLGQYPARVDYVENIYVYNNFMYNSSEGARIKVWPDSYSEKSASLSGGGGRGMVRNVTYDTMFLDNVDYGLTITQCYGQDDEEECFKHPSKLLIKDITFRNIRGRTNRVFSPLVGHLVCSSPDTCENIVTENIDIRHINGSNLITCRNIDPEVLGLGERCTEWSKGYNPA